MSVTWTEAATAQLEAIKDFLAQSSPGYARTLSDRIVRRADVLATMPRLGAEVPEYRRKSIREIFEHPYRIIYRLKGKEVEIVAVIHAARKLPRRPPT